MKRIVRALGPKLNGDYPSPPLDLFGGTNPDDSREVYSNLENGVDVKEGGASAKLNWYTDTTTLTSLTAFRETDFHALLDGDTTEIDYSYSEPNENSRTITQEFQLSSSDEGPLMWLGGLFFLREDASQEVEFGITPFDILINTFAESKVDSHAAFGQVSYQLTKRTNIVGGLRYSVEKKQHILRNGATDGPVIDDSEKQWSALMPRFVLEHSPGIDTMTYISVTRGFKSGGFNSAGIGEQFDPEYLWSYETGIKTSLNDGRLRLNAAAFYYDYTDMQVQRILEDAPSVFLLENAAKAEVRGGEIEIFWRPTPGLGIDFAAAFLDSKYTEYISVDPDGPEPAVNQDLAGRILPRAPKVSAYAGIEYTRPVNGYGALSTRVDWKYQSETFFSQFNSEGVKQEAFHLLDARVAFNSANGKWKLALWGKNLLDTLYRQNVIRATQIVGTLDFWGAPRTLGLQLAWAY